MNSALNKYKIGLAVIGAFSLILFGLVIMQASGTKQDNETYEKANKIADELDSYVLRRGVPESLEDAGISNVPDEVSYEKISDTKYKFCVTYKTKSSSFNGDSLFWSVSSGSAQSDYEEYEDEESYYLYLSPTHDKGENCQTVKSYEDEYDYEDYEYDYNYDDTDYQEY